MNIDTDELQKAVVDQAVANLVESLGDPAGDIGETIRGEAGRIVKEKIKAAVDLEIRNIIDSGLETLLIPNTNAFGDCKGAPRTVREFIAKAVDDSLNSYVDSNGNVTSDQWYRKPENMRVNQLIKQAIGPIVETEVRAAAEKMKTTINHYLGEFVKVHLAEAVKLLR